MAGGHAQGDEATIGQTHQMATALCLQEASRLLHILLHIVAGLHRSPAVAWARQEEQLVLRGERTLVWPDKRRVRSGASVQQDNRLTLTPDDDRRLIHDGLSMFYDRVS